MVYYHQDKPIEAGKKNEQYLERCEEAFGPDDPVTLNAANTLGVIYAEQDKLIQAEKMFKRALDGKERTFGPDHNSTIDTVYGLGNLYFKWKKLDDAESMYQRTLHGLKELTTTFAPPIQDERILDIGRTVGFFFAAQGKPIEAVKVLRIVWRPYNNDIKPNEAAFEEAFMVAAYIRAIHDIYESDFSNIKLPSGECSDQRRIYLQDVSWGMWQDPWNATLYSGEPFNVNEMVFPNPVKLEITTSRYGEQTKVIQVQGTVIQVFTAIYTQYKDYPELDFFFEGISVDNEEKCEYSLCHGT